MECMCPVCYDPCMESSKETCAVIPCGHVFHTECLINWEAASRKKACAICSGLYSRIIRLYPTTSSDEVLELHARPNITTKNVQKLVSELENKIEQLNVTEVSSSVPSTHEIELRKKLVVRELQLGHAIQENNAMAFKLSMYEEMFGKECSDHFDRMIHDRGDDE